MYYHIHNIISVNFLPRETRSINRKSGFKKHCHALFTFKEVSKCFINNGGKVYCAFIDASKAFDKVLHNGIKYYTTDFLLSSYKKEIC